MERMRSKYNFIKFYIIVYLVKLYYIKKIFDK